MRLLCRLARLVGYVLLWEEDALRAPLGWGGDTGARQTEHVHMHLYICTRVGLLVGLAINNRQWLRRRHYLYSSNGS